MDDTTQSTVLKSELKQQSSIISPPVDTEGSQTTAKKVPNPLHDLIFQKFLDYRQRNPSFVYWLRSQNTNNRLNQGIWFQGTETYAAVGLYRANSGNLSTKSVALVFWVDNEDDKEIGLTFEVLHRNEGDEKKREFYNVLRQRLKSDFDGRSIGGQAQFEDHGEDRFKVFLAYGDPFQAAFEFLDKYKGQMDEMIIKRSLHEEFFIEPNEFERKLANSIRRRAAIGHEQFVQDSEEDQAELADAEELEQSIRNSRAFISLIRISETEIPVIGASELAKEYANLVSQLKPEKGMMLGLFGQWGRGKTFLFDLVWKELKSTNKFYRVDFHAWKYQDTSASWGYLYESFADAYYGEKWFKKSLKIIRLNYHRSNKWSYWLFLGGLVIAGGNVILSNYLDFVYLYFAPLLSIFPILLDLYRKQSSTAKSLIRKYTSRHTYDKLLGVQAEIQKELKILLRSWITNKEDKRIVLFVDDIDRCGEERIIQVVDSLRVMLEDDEISKKLIVIAAIDQRILRTAIRLKYQKLVSSTETFKQVNDLIKEYMDKLFISSLHLGALTLDERGDVLRALVDRSAKRTQGDKPINSQGLSVSNKVPTVLPGSNQKEYGNEEDKRETEEQRDLVIKTDKARMEKKENSTSGQDEIESFEFNLLEDGIRKLKSATPRSIRVFYFRYIIAKNFVIRLKGHEGWGQEADIKLFIDLIVFLSNSDLIADNVRSLLNEKIALSVYHSIESQSPSPSSDPDYVRWTMLIRYQELDSNLKNDICGVLEMVMAY